MLKATFSGIAILVILFLALLVWFVAFHWHGTEDECEGSFHTDTVEPATDRKSDPGP